MSNYPQIPRAKIVECPACGSPGYLAGSQIKVSRPTLRDQRLYWEEIYLPTSFHCVCCDLNLKGHAVLQGANMGGQFAIERSSSASEYYSPGEEYFEEYNNM